MFNADKLTADRGGDLVRLGRFRQAQIVLHDALDRLDPALKKHRATASVDLADAYIQDGKVDDGAHHASPALAIIGTGHAESLRRVEAIHVAIHHHETPAVRDLDGQVLALKAAS